ncbi:MAG TPA: PfkB family carbohydrate kinase [Tepidisphaeraceae bacterium]|jgi:rfaE bifunctional protein kinase chain/domain/rfaE bifunctional protein nucleotidyltransferase chain/domain
MAASRKVCNLNRLLQIRSEARARGQTLVHCHGCFDIVHPGHIHYLQFARAQGDMLVVSVSADPQVNKGADRPLIPEDLRAGSLAALECVDVVYVNPHPTAVELLEQLKPDVYVKGREYETNNDPRFLAERDTVTRHGGRVVFSSGDVIYSSSSLIGGMSTSAFNGEKLRRYLDAYDLGGRRLLDLVGAFRDRKVVVVGDYILDRYHFCEPASVAAESPMMNLQQLKTEDFDGAAGVIALHLAGLGAAPTLVTALGMEEESDRVEERLRRRGVSVAALRTRRQLPLKRRYLAELTKVLKIDEGGSSAHDSKVELEFAGRILEASADAAAVIFADFGYGVITPNLLVRVMPELRKRVNVITADVSGMRSNLLQFRDVDLFCPTEREVRETLHDFSTGINNIVYGLLSKTGAKQALVTLGKQGLIVFDQYRARAAGEAWERKLRSEYLPALATQAIDPLGCGDALLAAASLTLAVGGSVQAAAYLGSVAAAFEVQRVGNQPVTSEDLLAGLALPASVNQQARRLAS